MELYLHFYPHQKLFAHKREIIFEIPLQNLIYLKEAQFQNEMCISEYGCII